MTEMPPDDPVIILSFRRRWRALAWAYARWLGYKVRPYDQFAPNERRWFWQKRTPCATLRLTPDQERLLRETVERWKKSQ